MTQATDKEQRARLRSLYRIAIALTQDPDEAVRLLDATAARVEGDPAYQGLPLNEWYSSIVAAMLRTQREHSTDEQISDSLTPTQDAPFEEERASLKAAHMLRPVIGEKLPIVWATISEEDRAVLMLGDVEALQTESLATALEQSQEQAEEHLRQARQHFISALLDEMTPRQRILARRADTSRIVAEQLRRYVREDTNRAQSSIPDSISDTLMASMQPLKPKEALPSSATKTPRAAPVQRKKPASALRYVLLVAVLVLAVGVVGYMAAQYFEDAPETNLITLSAERAPEITPIVHTDQLDEAERFVFEQHGTRLILPSIDQAVLMGASITQVAPGIEVPTFLYEENTGGIIALYAYNYRLLDRHGDRLQLTSDVLRQIEDDTQYDIHDLGTAQVLIWRHRSTIYAAVTEHDASELRSRIIMPS